LARPHADRASARRHQRRGVHARHHRHGQRVGALIAGGVVGTLLVACAAPARFGVATTIVKPTGNCDTSRVVEVGASLALSGRQAALGREYLAGLEMAVSHVNHTGGILGNHSCLELLYKNDRGSVPVADRAVLDLANREMVAFLVGPLLSTQTQSARGDLAVAGIPTASFSGLADTFRRDRYPWTFPLASSIPTMVASMAAFAHSNGWSRVGVVASDDPAGRQGTAAFGTVARHDRLTVAGPVFVSPGRSPEEGLQRLRETDPDGLVVIDDSLDVAAVLKARTELRWGVPVVAESIATDQTVIASVGMTHLAGVFAAVPQAVVAQSGTSDADVRRFRNQVRDQLHAINLDGSIVPYAQAYDAISMMASAARSIHSKTPANVRTFLENANYQGLLASYAYTATAHTGIPGDQSTIVPVTSLTNGLFRPAPG
jgi:ABC-type branched-subunit amino acid transport system substrate-binding protein